MIGTTISHYRIEAELGHGGMGVVYKAYDTRLDRIVALKCLPPGRIRDDRHRKRIISEAQAASALNHPNILTIHDIDEVDDCIFIIMEYLDGQTLQDRLAEGPLSIESVVEIIYQIAAGLRVAHDKGIIHRDIKPANIMLTAQGRVKIMDFGLAKRAGGEIITEVGHTVGTAAYMSPEQTRGEKSDLRTDIWSLGVILFEMLTGDRPFKGEYVAAIVYSVLNEEAKDPRVLNPDTPGVLADMIERCLQKDRENRYADLGDLQSELSVFIAGEGITLSSEASIHYQPPRKTSRTSTVVLAVFAGILFWVAFQTIRTTLFPGNPDLPLRIAVLPVNPVGDGEVSKMLCDGLVHNLTEQLTEMKGLRNRLSVIPAIEIISSGIRSASQADSLFGIDLAISGVISRTGQQIGLSMTLIDAALSEARDVISISADRSNLLSLQNGAGPALAALLGFDFSADIGREYPAGGTTVPEAFALYLEGQGNLQHHTIEENVDAAIELFENAIAADERYALAHAGAGEAYGRKYDLTDDIAWFDKALASAHLALGLDDGLAPVHQTLGFIHQTKGNHEEAEDSYRQALTIDPNSIVSKLGIADALAGQGSSELAEASYLDAIDDWDEFYLSHNRLGIFYYGQDRFQEAETQFQRVINLNPNFEFGYNNLSSTYGQLGRTKEMIPLLERAIEINPNNAMPLRNLAALYYFENGDYAGAARLLERAGEISELNYRTWSMLGNAYYWAPGEREKAEAAWNRTIEHARDALRINPDNYTAKRFLAETYASLGRTDEAMELVRQFQGNEPLGTGSLITISHVFHRMGERDSALVYIQRAAEEGIESKYVLQTPWFEDLKSDPRFRDIEAIYSLETTADGE